MELKNSLFVETKLLGSELPEKRDYDIHYAAEFAKPDEIVIYVRFIIEEKVVSGFTAQLAFKEDQSQTVEVLHEAIDLFVEDHMNTLQQIDRMYLNSVVTNYNTGYKQ